MRIALVGHGVMPIPPQGWGAVEILIWEYAQRLRERGIEVEIVNVPHRVAVKEFARLRREGKKFDWIWCHNERAVPYLARAKWVHGARLVSTCHTPMTDLHPTERFDHARPLRKAARAPYQLTLIEEAGLMFKTLNLDAKIAHLPNGVDTNGFRFDPGGGNGRALCLGAIQPRKRQRRLADLADAYGLPIDFAGPTKDDVAPEDRIDGRPNYLGPWDRETVKDRLTEYSALVLWSASEVQALVVVEAMAAGLNVVVSPESANNLDLSQPFLRAADTPEQVAGGIRDMIAANPLHRPQIRAHAEQEWDWGRMTDRVLAQLQEWEAA
ncbi:hypothetical protein BH11ARM2_BH11ARM2_07980 [soil metagenome]